MKYRIWVDFNNKDEDNNVRLNCLGTIEQIESEAIPMVEGQKVVVFCDDDYEEIMEVEGILKQVITPPPFQQKIWIAVVNWDTFKRVKKID